MDQIAEYGQTPKQLFYKPHPEKKRMKKNKLLLCNPLKLKFIKGNLLIKLNEQITYAKETNFNFKDFIIKDENDWEFFENFKGLSSFIRKKPLELSTKEIQNNLVMVMKGSYLSGSDSNIINYDNFYKGLLVYEMKFNEIKYLEFCSFDKEISKSFIISKGKNFLAFGDKFGFIEVYAVSQIQNTHKSSINFPDLNLIKLNKQKKNENNFQKYNFTFQNDELFLPKIEQTTFENLKKSSKIEVKKKENIEIQLQLKKGLKKHFIKLNPNENNKKNLKFFSSANIFNEDLLKTKKDFCHFYEIINNNTTKNEFIPSELEKNTSQKLEFITVLAQHDSEVTYLEIACSFSILISSDKKGILCLWEMNTWTLIHKIYTYHFSESKIFKDICYYELNIYENFENFESKITSYHNTLTQREAAKYISICQENGEFALVSANYISIYSINGVLTSVMNTQQEKLPKFTTAYLFRVIFSKF